MTNERTKAGFDRLGPWVTRFLVDGAWYGGEYDFGSDPRVGLFLDLFPAASRILELGSLEGGHTLALAAPPRVTRVVGVEAREGNVARARYALSLLPSPKVEFVTGNLETMDLAPLGRFDAVFCSGLLYHLPRPWELLARLPAAAPDLFLWTHYSGAADSAGTVWPGKVVGEFGLDDPLSGMSAGSFWPTLPALEGMLRQAGYGTLCRLRDEALHPQGPAILLAATSRPLPPGERGAWISRSALTRLRSLASRLRAAARRSRCSRSSRNARR